MNLSQKVKVIAAQVESNGWHDDCELLLAAADALDAKIDPRWRPMRTAPRDGTVVECRVADCEVEGDQATVSTLFLHAKWTGKAWLNVEINGVCPGEMEAWRPAHPEWQEGGS